MANKFICEWCSGGFRTETGLAWHIERSHPVQAPPEDMTLVQVADEGEVPTIVEEEPTAPNQEDPALPELPQATPEELRAEIVEIINAVVEPQLSALRSELRAANAVASNNAELKVSEEKRAVADQQAARDAKVDKELKALSETLETNDKVTSVIAAISIRLDAKPGDDPGLINMVGNRLNASDRAATREMLISYFRHSPFGARAHSHRPRPQLLITK